MSCRRRQANPAAGSSFRQTEVEHLDGAVRRHLDVGRFEIAVDDALLVRRLERLGNLAGDRHRFVERNRPRAMRSASVWPSTNSRRAPAHRRSLRDRRSRRCADGSARPAPAPRAETGQPLGVARDDLRQNLIATSRCSSGIAGAVHLAHASRAEQPGLRRDRGESPGRGPCEPNKFYCDDLFPR